MTAGIFGIVTEYRRYQETGRSPPAKNGCAELPDGRMLELCSSNGEDWTVCIVRPDDSALTPVAVGKKVDRLLVLVEDLTARWSPSLWPPPLVFVEGAPRVFVPVGRSTLLGIVELKQGVLLLGVVKRAETSDIALLHLVGTRISVLHVGGPMDLRGLNMDALLALQAETHAGCGDLPTEIWAAFARLATRATARTPEAPTGERDNRRRGIGAVMLLVWAIVQLVRSEKRDLVGHLGEIERQLQAIFPGIDLPNDVLGDVLALLLEVKTCLVTRAGRVWRIRVWGLMNPASALYRRFCAEATAVVVDVESFISALQTRPARTVRVNARSRNRTANPGSAVPDLSQVPSENGGAEPAPITQPVHGPASITSDDQAGALAVVGLMLQGVGRLLMPAGHAGSSPEHSGSPSAVPAVVPNSSGSGLAPQPAASRGARKLYVMFENEWFPVDKDEYVIGRVQKFSDLVIKDAKMSRRHCSIVRRNDDYFIKDLGSTHGIEFEGARVDHHKIMEGSIYSLCNHELRFSFSPSGVD